MKSSVLCGCIYYITRKTECKLTQLDSFETAEDNFIFTMEQYPFCIDIYEIL